MGHGSVESWLARDILQLLGYAEWRNFRTSAVAKAMTACEVSGHPVTDHFVDVNKMVQLGSGSAREIIIFNSRAHGMRTDGAISSEHVTNRPRPSRRRPRPGAFHG